MHYLFSNSAFVYGTGPSPETLTFTVTLDSASAEPVTVDYATADDPTGRAKAGVDYVAAEGTLTFAPGVLNQSVAVEVLPWAGPGTPEGQHFSLNLSNARGATLESHKLTGTIRRVLPAGV